MRPVRLKLQAFGPFVGEEIVDFREPVAAGLFGIYGQTGSGKSTIFSALTFALFGEATKTDQEAQTLRSDHAGPKTATELEFIFEVGDRQYVVVRRPEQTRTKQRGTGETTAPHEAYLFDATGLSVDEISAGNRGKVLAERKTGVVDEAIVDILGYGAKQFRQIVLLPQGKFEMFLAAKTDDRLAILRDLFDVSIYRQLAAKFKDSAADAEREVAQERDVCARRLKAAGFESSDALEVGIATAAGEHALAVEAEGKAYQAGEGARAELDEGRRIDGLFVAAETAAAALVERLGQEEEFRELCERVVVARRVRGLADVERHAVEAAVGATGFEERLREAREASTAAVVVAGVAKSALEELKAKAHEIDAFRQKSEALERHRQALVAAAGLGKEATYQAGFLGKAKKAFEDAEWRHGELAKQKAALELSLKTATEKTASRAALDLKRAGLKSALKDAERFEQAKDKCAKAKRAREAATFKEKAEAADEAKGRFDQAEAELSAVQALHLAAKLKDGEACPVCGSHEHPALATGAIENRGLDQAFREAREAWEAARDEREKASAAFASATGVADAMERDFAELAEPAQPSAALREAVTGVEKDLVNLGEPVDLAGC
jgi:exonuclease SbcC